MANRSAIHPRPNAVATIVVARWDKALDVDALRAALNGRSQPIAVPMVEADED